MNYIYLYICIRLYTSPETDSSQIAGYAVEYNLSSIDSSVGSFQFMTIRGAGHMVVPISI
jgi:hypothetical protein